MFTILDLLGHIELPTIVMIAECLAWLGFISIGINGKR